MSNNYRVRFMYVRDARFEPVGCIAIRVDRSRNRAEFGLSVIHPKDSVNAKGRKVRFDRQKAQELALVRLVEAPERVYVSNNASQHEITEAVMKGVIASYAPSKAVKFAKRWLQYAMVIRNTFNEDHYQPNLCSDHSWETEEY